MELIYINVNREINRNSGRFYIHEMDGDENVVLNIGPKAQLC